MVLLPLLLRVCQGVVVPERTFLFVVGVGWLVVKGVGGRFQTQIKRAKI